MDSVSSGMFLCGRIFVTGIIIAGIGWGGRNSASWHIVLSRYERWHRLSRSSPWNPRKVAAQNVNGERRSHK